MQAHVLLVEDDVRLAKLIREFLQSEGLRVSIEHRGDRAVARIQAEQPDCLILDLMLPGEDGFSICRQVRSDYHGPIMMFTARDEDIDQIVGLELGADDYICKPVEPRVLLARIRALLRRTRADNNTSANTDQHRIGGLSLCLSSREVYLDGQEIQLGDNEFELLALLMNQVGSVLSRDHLLRQLRGIDYDGLDRSVDLGISRLRRKLGATEKRGIRTVRGKGYLLVAEHW